MIITPGNAASVLGGLFAAYQTKWGQAYQTTPIWHDKLATTEGSSTFQNIYAFMQRTPKMRKWVGDRSARALAAYAYALVNDDYESTLTMDRNKIEDDQYGVYAMETAFLGMQAKKWPDYLVRDAMVNGHTSLCYDGQNFFDTTHPVNKYDPTILASGGGNTQSNYATNMPLTVQNYATQRAAFMSLVGEDGESFGLIPDTLVVPPQLEAAGKQVVEAKLIAPSTYPGAASNVGSIENTYAGSAKLLVVPDLTTEGNAWYLACTTFPIKPLVFQLRKAPALVPLMSPTDPNVFFKKEYVMGADSRGAAGYALWWLMQKNVIV